MGDSNRGRTVIWLLGALSAHLLAALMLLSVLLKIVPQCVEVFKQRNTLLPGGTILVISLSNWIAAYGYLAIPLLGALDAAVLYFLRRLGENARWLAGTWVVCVLLAVMLMMAFVTVGATLPLVWLVTNLSEG
jgi:type II secretory pathway component PulF